MAEQTTIQPSLSIYAAYSALPVSAVADLNGALARMSVRIILIHAEFARVRPQEFPPLEVVTISTGESIKFTFGEGWMPSISSNKDDDIVIDVPKKLGIPLMVGYLLLSGAQKCLDLHNTHLDNQIKEVELQLKETELQKTLMESEKQVGQLQNEGMEVVTMIQNNQIYQVFHVNGVSILDKRGDSNDKQNETNNALE